MCRSLGSPSGLRPSGDPRDLHIRSTLIRNLSHALTGDNLYLDTVGEKVVFVYCICIWPVKIVLVFQGLGARSVTRFLGF